jgi:hypothetical protein
MFAAGNCRDALGETGCGDPWQSSAWIRRGCVSGEQEKRGKQDHGQERMAEPGRFHRSPP